MFNKPKILHSAIGPRLAEVRRRNALTQSQLGDLCGVSRAIILQWESGDSKPDLGRLIALRSKLDFSLAWLLTGEGGENGSNITSCVTDRRLFNRRQLDRR